MEERELLRRMRRGDTAALEEVIDCHMAFACGLAGSILRGSPRDAEEVVSDAFLALWEHVGQIQPGRLRPWLGRVVRNKALNRLRELVRDLLDQLSPQDRAIFLRHYYYGQTAAEIGGALALSPSTVKVRLHRGRKKLKEILSERGYPCACADI